MNHQIFESNPSMKEFFQTSDGQSFYALNAAANHARTLEDRKVKTITRDEDAEDSEAEGDESTKEETKEAVTEEVSTEEIAKEASTDEVTEEVITEEVTEAAKEVAPVKEVKPAVKKTVKSSKQ